jgi:hypothetical protein
MQKKVSYGLVLMTVLFSGFSINAWWDSNFCPVHSIPAETVMALPQKENCLPKTSYSITRDQVLLEIITATW